MAMKRTLRRGLASQAICWGLGIWTAVGCVLRARGRMPSSNRSTVGAGFGRPGPAVDRGATEYSLDAKEAHVTVKSSGSLTDEQHAFARALVEAGRYSSLSAVLQQGVDLLRQRLDAEALETAA